MPKEGPAGLGEVFARAGIDSAPQAARVPRVVALTAAPLDDDQALTVALYDGTLTPAHAELFRGERPPLLLACRLNGGPSEWEARALAVVLSGLQLPAIAPVASFAWRIAGMEDLRAIAQQAHTLAVSAGAGPSAASIVSDVMYELAANALLDAPHHPDGTAKYAHQRGAEVVIEPSDACRASIAIAGGRAYLSATDRFGRLTVTPIFNVLAGLAAKAQVNASGGGAGLGLRRLVEHSDLIAVRVSPARASEVLCAVDLGDTRRRSGSPKSLLFTSSPGL